MITAGIWNLGPFAGWVSTDLLLRESDRSHPGLAGVTVSAGGFDSKGLATFYNSDTGD
jgi:hypothetical protein